MLYHTNMVHYCFPLYPRGVCGTYTILRILWLQVQSPERAVRSAAVLCLNSVALLQAHSNRMDEPKPSANTLPRRAFFKLLRPIVAEADELINDSAHLPRLLRRLLSVPKPSDEGVGPSTLAGEIAPTICAFLFARLVDAPSTLFRQQLLIALEGITSYGQVTLPITRKVLAKQLEAIADDTESKAYDCIDRILRLHLNVDTAPLLEEADMQLLQALLRDQVDPSSPSDSEKVLFTSLINILAEPVYAQLSELHASAVFDALLQAATHLPAELADLAKGCVGRFHLRAHFLEPVLSAAIAPLKDGSKETSAKKRKTKASVTQDASDVVSSVLESDAMRRCTVVLERVISSPSSVGEVSSLQRPLFEALRTLLEAHTAESASGALGYTFGLILSCLSTILSLASQPGAKKSKGAAKSACSDGEIAAVVDVMRLTTDLRTRAEALGVLSMLAVHAPKDVWAQLLNGFKVIAPSALARHDNFSLQVIEQVSHRRCHSL